MIGPGSLYTSIIPNLLVEGVTETLMRSRATRVYIANLMTQPGETQGFSVADHVRAIYEHSRSGLFHWVVTNRTPIAARILRRYRKQGAEPVQLEEEKLERMGIGRVSGDLVQQEGVVRHDAERLARLLLKTFVKGGQQV